MLSQWWTSRCERETLFQFFCIDTFIDSLCHHDYTYGQPSESTIQLMKHTLESIKSASNPQLLEMRILTHHASDARFDFLRARGKYHQAWQDLKAGGNMVGQQERKSTAAPGGLAGLVGAYDDDSSNDDDDQSSGQEQEPLNRAPSELPPSPSLPLPPSSPPPPPPPSLPPPLPDEPEPTTSTIPAHCNES